MTLPLIYALNNSSWSTRRHVLRTIRSKNIKPKKVKEVIDFVKKSGGIEYAQGKMDEYYEKAIQMLETFGDSDYKRSLKELVTFTIERKK